VGLEREIKEFDRQIKEARRAAVAALTLEEKLAGQKQIKAIEAERVSDAGHCSMPRRRLIADANSSSPRLRGSCNKRSTPSNCLLSVGK
jgi:hypothetical protein